MSSDTSVSTKVLGPILDDFGLGRIFTMPAKEPVEYQPYEVSRMSLGIVAAPGLQEGQALVLESNGQKVELAVELAGLQGDVLGNVRYHLGVKGVGSDLERLFAQSGCQRKLALVEKNIQCARFDAIDGIKVQAKTFGARDRYGLTSLNVSKTGLLMAAHASDRVPFIVNTLLEVRLEAPSWLKEPVTGLAKVIRHTTRTASGEKRVEFGIRFIEFNEEGMDLWKNALNHIEAELRVK